MFTGIVEDMGRVVYIRSGEICIDTSIKGVEVGDSIMVNGICLTAKSVNGRRVCMDAGLETLRRTALRGIRPGSNVNLESAMTLNKKIGGHLVYGHVMEVGRIVSNKRTGNTHIIKIGCSLDFLGKLVQKGSVAVNGVSLTVNEMGDRWFSVGIIPETSARTNLCGLSVSSSVNLEPDMLLAGLNRQGN